MTGGKRSSHRQTKLGQGLKEKDLIGLPWRVAFALQADGWWLRSDIIWFKDNPMPESVKGWRWERHRVEIGRHTATARKPAGWDTSPASHVGVPTGRYSYDHEHQREVKWSDCPGCPKCAPTDGLVLRRGSWRPTRTHEYVFLLSKRERYFCDDLAIQEPSVSGSSGVRKMLEGRARIGGKHKVLDDQLNKASAATNIGRKRGVGNPSGRNARSVWPISTEPYKGAHFATFPKRLVAPCILAGTSEKGACAMCGAPWARVTSTIYVKSPVHGVGSVAGRHCKTGANNWDGAGLARLNKEVTTLCWRPTCQCGSEETVPSLVLDPFCGTGTVPVVAKDLGRIGIGVDLKLEYLSMRRDEMSQKVLL